MGCLIKGWGTGVGSLMTYGVFEHFDSVRGPICINKDINDRQVPRDVKIEGETLANISSPNFSSLRTYEALSFHPCERKKP